MMVFEERGKREYPGEYFSSTEKNQKQNFGERWALSPLRHPKRPLEKKHNNAKTTLYKNVKKLDGKMAELQEREKYQPSFQWS